MVVVVVVVVVIVVTAPMARAVAGEPQHQGRINLTPFHGQDWRPRPQGWAQAVLQGGQRCWIEAVSPADQHEIGGFELFLKEILNGSGVIQAWIGQALGLKGFRVGHHMAGSQGLAIDNGHDAIHPGSGSNLWPSEGSNQRFREGEATGFDDDAVELVCPLQQPLHRGKEIILNGAAQATIGQLDKATLELLLRAKTTTAQQLTIDANLAKFIHQYGEPQAAGKQQLAQQGGFASP
jgi:hypothetical protein